MLSQGRWRSSGSVSEVSHRHEMPALFISSVTSAGRLCCHPLKFFVKTSLVNILSETEHRSSSLDAVAAIRPEAKKKVKDGSRVHETCSKRKVKAHIFATVETLEISR